MGQLYSHLVFRPPTMCTYESTNGLLKYVVPDHAGIPTIHSAELVWLLNNMQFRIPCAMVRQPDAEYVAIYAHQNGEDLGSSILDAHMLSAGLGIDVLAFEYSGYGLSEKPQKAYPSSRNLHAHAVAPSFQDADRRRAEPSEKACCSDIIAAYSYLTDQCNISPSRIIIFGRSIGSGPAVYCATSRKVGGLVLISPIASAVRVPLKRLNITLPFVDTFPNIDRASKIKCPVLVVHGDMDEIVPKVHAEKLFEKIRQNGNAVKPLWIPTARHNNIVEDFHSVVFGRYHTFLDELRSMRVDRKSIEDNPVLFRRNQHERERRPLSAPRRRRNILTCLRPPRISFDKFSTRARTGDPESTLMDQLAARRPTRHLPSIDYNSDVEVKQPGSIESEEPPPVRKSVSSPALKAFRRFQAIDALTSPRATRYSFSTHDEGMRIETMSWDLMRKSIEQFEKRRAK